MAFYKRQGRWNRPSASRACWKGLSRRRLGASCTIVEHGVITMVSSAVFLAPSSSQTLRLLETVNLGKWLG